MFGARATARLEVTVWAALLRHRGIIFAGALFVLPVVLLYAQTRSPKARGPVVSVIVDAAGGIERGMLWATGGMSDFFDRYVTAINNADELATLRQGAQHAKVLEAEIRELEAANEQLRALASVATRIDGPRPVGARVIGRSGAPLARIARIDRGRRDGVRRGDGVVSSGGVVGRVLDAGFATSDVLLATDPASAIDVVVQRTRARGIVRGRGDTNAYRAEVQDFDRLADVKPTDVLVTSGLDPALPAGLYVGELTAVARHEDGLYQRAEVVPGADLSVVERVLVLVARQPSRRPRVGAEPASGDEETLPPGKGGLLLAPSTASPASTPPPTSQRPPPKLVPKRSPTSGSTSGLKSTLPKTTPAAVSPPRANAPKPRSAGGESSASVKKTTTTTPTAPPSMPPPATPAAPKPATTASPP